VVIARTRPRAAPAKCSGIPRAKGARSFASARSLFSKKQEWLRGGSARGRKLIDNMKEKQKTGIFSHKNSEGGAVRDVITLDKSLA
jgi:hypothetical protein